MDLDKFFEQVAPYIGTTDTFELNKEVIKPEVKKSNIKSYVGGSIGISGLSFQDKLYFKPNLGFNFAVEFQNVLLEMGYLNI